MNLNVVELAKELIAIKSVSQVSNREISDFLEELLKKCAFEVERLSFIDENGEEKVSLVAKKGSGEGGLGFFSHSDTVPGQEQDWEAFNPVVSDGRLIGRGSCDMKGALAATIVAANAMEVAQLQKPVFIVISADEEVGICGAQQVVEESLLFKKKAPEVGVIAEPTSLIPVHAHKGYGKIDVTAYGHAAHTSTDLGRSANFLIAPFFAEMAELAKQLESEASYMNNEFSPPTVGFNMVINDGNSAANVTAAKSVCSLTLRPMPNTRTEEIIQSIIRSANHYNLEVTSRINYPFYISPQAKIVQAACQATGVSQSQTVSYGTEAFIFKDYLDLVILGPGHIAQAHTVGEWLALDQLFKAVDVYHKMIQLLCTKQ